MVRPAGALFCLPQTQKDARQPRRTGGQFAIWPMEETPVGIYSDFFVLRRTGFIGAPCMISIWRFSSWIC